MCLRSGRHAEEYAQKYVIYNHVTIREDSLTLWVGRLLRLKIWSCLAICSLAKRYFILRSILGTVILAHQRASSTASPFLRPRTVCSGEYNQCHPGVLSIFFNFTSIRQSMLVKAHTNQLLRLNSLILFSFWFISATFLDKSSSYSFLFR